MVGVNPLKPNSSNCCTEHQSARMSEIENGRLGLYCAEPSRCNHLMILGFKGLE